MASSRRRKKRHKSSSATVKVGTLKQTRQFQDIKSIRIPGCEEDSEWDREKSLVNNYNKIGIVSNVNAFYHKGGRNAQKDDDDVNDVNDNKGGGVVANALQFDVERDEIRKAIGHQKSTGKAEPKRITPRQRRICEQLIQKYGDDDVEKMFRDIKLNVLQKTRGELRAMLESYQYWKDENGENAEGEIRVDFRAPRKASSRKASKF
mgnify:CR=1 FL=1|jgi:hypothetical protein